MCFLSVACCYGHRVEVAEAHGLIRSGVVAGRASQREGGVAPVVAGEGAVEGVGVLEGLRVELDGRVRGVAARAAAGTFLCGS